MTYLAEGFDKRLSAIEWMALALAALWIVVLYLADWPAPLRATFDSSLSIDSAVFAYAGKLLQGGGVPYLSYWDHRPPLVHFINATGLALSGGEPWGIWLIYLGSALAALGLAYASLRRLFGPPGAIVGALIFAFGLAAARGANGTEGYALPLQWAAFWVWTRWRAEGDARAQGRIAFLIGVLAALAFLLRPNLVGAMLAVAIASSVVLVARRRGRAWLAFAGAGVGGVLLVVAPLLLYLASAGALAAFYDQVLRYSQLYPSVTLMSRIKTAYSGLRLVSQYGALILGVAGWLLAAVRLKAVGHRRSSPALGVWVLAIIWLPLELGLAALSGRVYGHYFMALLLPLSFLAALAIHELLAPRRLFVAAVVLAVAIPATYDLALQLRNNGLPGRRGLQLAPTVEYIRANTAPTDPILVWGHAADLYFFSERPPSTRFIYPGPLLTAGYADSSLVAGFLAELDARPPALVIDASNARGLVPPEQLVPPLARWDSSWYYPDWLRPEDAWWVAPPALEAFYRYVAKEYDPVGSVGPQGWTIYRRVP